MKTGESSLSSSRSLSSSSSPYSFNMTLSPVDRLSSPVDHSLSGGAVRSLEGDLLALYRSLPDKRWRKLFRRIYLLLWKYISPMRYNSLQMSFVLPLILPQCDPPLTVPQFVALTILWELSKHGKRVVDTRFMSWQGITQPYQHIPTFVRLGLVKRSYFDVNDPHYTRSRSNTYHYVVILPGSRRLLRQVDRYAAIAGRELHLRMIEWEGADEKSRPTSAGRPLIRKQ